MGDRHDINKHEINLFYTFIYLSLSLELMIIYRFIIRKSKSHLNPRSKK